MLLSSRVMQRDVQCLYEACDQDVNLRDTGDGTFDGWVYEVRKALASCVRPGLEFFTL